MRGESPAVAGPASAAVIVGLVVRGVFHMEPQSDAVVRKRAAHLGRVQLRTGEESYWWTGSAPCASTIPRGWDGRLSKTVAKAPGIEGVGGRGGGGTGANGFSICCPAGRGRG